MEGTSLSSVEASDTQQISFDDSDLLHLLLDNSQDCIYYKDKESRFIKVNKKTVEVLGAENSKDVIGKSNDDFFPDIADRTRADELRIMETGQPQLNEEMNILFADGSMHWVSVSKVPFYDDQGDVVGIIGISRDITKRKIAEESLKKQSVLLAEAEKIAHIGGSEWHIRDNKFTMSEEWKRIHGCKSDVLTMKDLMKIAHPEDRAKIKKAFQDALEGNKPYDIEHRIIRQDDGKERIVRASGVLIKDEHEKPIKMYGIAQDITKQKETESRYNMIMENADVWINMTTFSTDPVYTYVNPSGGGPMQYKDDELIGKHVFDFMHPEDIQKLQPVLKKFVTMKEKNLLSELEKNLPQSFEWRFKDKKENGII